MGDENLFTSREDYTNFIDSQIPKYITEKYEKILINDGKTGNSPVRFEDLFILQEKARCETIKKLISSTHKWQIGTVMSGKKNKFFKDAFICKDCGYIAGIYNHISIFSIIEKIRDNIPTYDIHNEYIVYSCSDVQDVKNGMKLTNETYVENCICEDCFLPVNMCSGYLCLIDPDIEY